MHRVLFAMTLMLSPVTAFAAGSPGSERAVLLITDAGTASNPQARALRDLAAGELGRRGVSLVEQESFERVQPLDDRTYQSVSDSGASRLFSLRIGGALGSKFPLVFSEVDPKSHATVASAQLTATGLEESDVVVPRLVAAVLERKSAAQTAQVDTLTAQEGKAFQKRPGERFWSIGISAPLFGGQGTDAPFGFSLGYNYEAETFRLGALLDVLGHQGTTAGFFGLNADWLPMQTDFSPYIGGGLGYGGDPRGGGMIARAEAGVEMLRLRAARLQVGAEMLIPLQHDGNSYQQNNAHNVYPAALIRVSF